MRLLGVACVVVLLSCGGGGGGGGETATDEGKPELAYGDVAEAVDSAAVEADAAVDVEPSDVTPDAADAVWSDADAAKAETVQDPGPEAKPLTCQEQVGGSSTLPGVKIEFTGTTCEWRVSEAAKTIKIPYHVVIDKDLDKVTVKPQDAGGCGQPDAAFGNLILFAKVYGVGQNQWCMCDTGLCAGTVQTVTLKAGTYDGEFSWDGRNWQGPSDTGNPEGDPFPAGQYVVEMSAIGTATVYGVKQDFNVFGSFPIILDADPLPEVVEEATELPPSDFYIPAPEETEEAAAGEV